MTARRQKDSVDEVSVTEKEIGGQLLHFVNKHGELNTRTAIAEIRNSIPADSRPAKDVKIEIGETALEEMYRSYVTSCKDPVLTFIEYTLLVDFVINLMYLVRDMHNDEL